MDIDYSSGQLSPTNQGVLITGSATKAPVQDYNWNVRRSTLPRYAGSKLTGAKINVHTNGDISYGKEPVINNYQTSFLTFKEIRNAYPELVGKSTLWINSLVDKDGNQLTVDFSTGSNYYYNLIDNFGKDSQVNLQITTIPTGSISTDLDLSTTIYRPALLWPKVILTNETGSRLSDNNTISYTTSNILTAITTDTLGLSSQIFSSSLWSVGTDSRNILTSSTQLGDNYYFYNTAFNGQFGQLIQLNNTQGYGGVGGYDTITQPILFKSGQEIRFSQDENKTYTITNVVSVGSIFSTGSGRVYLTLDRPIPTADTMSINSGGYLIREYQVDPSKLVINTPKLVGGAPGYLTPQYMSPDLIASLDKTVETLKETRIL
jgi:hypothetical protein